MPKKTFQRNKLTHSLTQNTLQDKLLHPRSTQLILLKCRQKKKLCLFEGLSKYRRMAIFFRDICIFLLGKLPFDHVQQQQINMFCPEGCILKKSLSWDSIRSALYTKGSVPKVASHATLSFLSSHIIFYCLTNRNEMQNIVTG